MGRRVAEKLLRLSAAALLNLPAAAQSNISITAVTTSAGFVSGLPSYGGLASIFVTGLTGFTGIVGAQTWPLPTSLAGVSVYFGTLAAPILALADGNGYQQINVQVPYEAASFSITVVEGDTPSAPVTPPFDNAPGEFFQDAMGNAIIQHASDYSPVTTAHPATKGETLVAYASGLGAVSPVVVSGTQALASPVSYALIFIDTVHDAFSLNIGGASTGVMFAGLTPGLAGLYQINFQVPQAAPSGDVQMTMVLDVCPSGCGSTPPNTLLSRPVKLAIQ